MSNEKLRTELIQVAAVAVAIVEDLDYGAANALVLPNYNENVIQVDRVLNDVRIERIRQDAKWGPQSHVAKTWLAIMMEEVGEAASEVSIPGYRDTRSPVDYIVDRMQKLGRRAMDYLNEVGLG